MVLVTPVPASVSQVETPETSPVSEMGNCQVDLYSTSQGAGHTVTSQVSSLPTACQLAATIPPITAHFVHLRMRSSHRRLLLNNIARHVTSASPALCQVE